MRRCSSGPYREALHQEPNRCHVSLEEAANHLTRLDQRCKADLAWWHTYIEAWNATGLFPRLPDDPSITADASGSWGAGAFISLDHAWFQIQWPDSWSAINIAAKELLPIVVALAIRGSSEKGVENKGQLQKKNWRLF